MEQIHTLYQKRGYFDRYGGDVCISIVLILLTIAITGFTSYQAVMAQVKTNWNQQRCNPIYMPFAGVIMPQPGVSTLDTTVTNFSYCIKQDVSAVFSIALMPLEFAMYLIIDFIDAVLSAIMAIMEFIKWLKNRFVINHAILLKFKRDGDIKDKSSVDFILKLDKELRNWYRKSSISIFQSYDDRYNKPLRGWDDICENFFDELPN